MVNACSAGMSLPQADCLYIYNILFLAGCHLMSDHLRPCRHLLLRTALHVAHYLCRTLSVCCTHCNVDRLRFAVCRSSPMPESVEMTELVKLHFKNNVRLSDMLHRTHIPLYPFSVSSGLFGLLISCQMTAAVS